jgi:hypothetical protein
MPRPYSKTTHGGKVVDEITHQALLAAEKRLGYELTVYQGSYNAGGVAASGGTHDGGGAVDLAPYDWRNKVRALRAVGFAAWYRKAIPGLWGAHIHAVLIGNKKLSPSAKAQVAAYYAGRDGLASNGPDPHHRPRPIPVFQMPKPHIDRQFTLGAHNLHDEAGRPTEFADVVLFCEAVVPSIRERMGRWVRGLRLLHPEDQPDLAILLPRRLFKVTDRYYFLAHKGITKVTPRRGTFVLKTIHRKTGRKVAFVLEHRVNAAFPPFKRGHAKIRAALWRQHTNLTLGVIADLKVENYAVFAGGDLNTPPDVKGYEGSLVEVNTALDRLAHSRDAALVDFERLSAAKSDHHRIRATAEL